MDVELTAAREVNFRSDFDLLLELRDGRGELVGWPAWDWRAVFWTWSTANAFEASCIGGVCSNCINDGGRIHVVFDGHGLSAGELKVRFTAELPSELYPDGSRRLDVPAKLGVVLTREAACPQEISAELVVPYVKGKFEDLTEEERAELARPATEAAARADAATLLATAAVESAGKLEQAIEKEEAARESNERTRVRMEEARERAERLREEAEKLRAEAEALREEAEELRKNEFAGFAETLDGKQDRLEFSDDFNYSGTRLAMAEEARRRRVIDLFNMYCCYMYSGGFSRSCGGFNEETGYGECNGITDIGFDEMEAMVAHAPFTRFIPPAYQRPQWGFNGLMSSSLRTAFPVFFPHSGGSTGSMARMFRGWGSLESVFMAMGNFSDYTETFSGCAKLREVDGHVGFSVHSDGKNVHTDMFKGCVSLETARLSYLHADLSLADCPRLSLDSISYIIAHRQGTNVITLTLHADVYAALTDEVIDAALKKNVSLAQA